MENKFKSPKGGIIQEGLSLLNDRAIISKNLCWKPDNLSNSGKRLFFPYLDIGFVKARLIEVCGAGNIQFNIEKENGSSYAIGSMAILVDGDWIWNSAIGTERESKVKDKTKRDKVVYKGNHSDAYKSCAELFGLIVPADIKGKWLPERDKVVFTAKNKPIGNVDYDKAKINAYLNNMNGSLQMMAQVYKSNEDLFKSNSGMDKSFRAIAEFLKNND